MASEWKLVPVEMTDEIRNAIYMALHYDMSVMNPDEWGAVDKAYAAMLEAAPQPAPDVSGLVEALECALETMENVDGSNDCSRGIEAVEEALAAYHDKQEGKSKS